MLSKSNQHERLIFNGLMDIGGMYSNFATLSSLQMVNGMCA
uniref:Uncharacterized protein n=1 Tax=Anguilla anguilla TaxID=7936 RepID=A0A0E9UFI6_ANGAN